MPRGPRSTPGRPAPARAARRGAGGPRPQPGEVVVDCTVGWAGHAVELLRRVGPDRPARSASTSTPKTCRAPASAWRRSAIPFSPAPRQLRRPAGASWRAEGLAGVDVLLADLGMSSMQVDDPERGFSYVRDGPLDMRMDRTPRPDRRPAAGDHPARRSWPRPCASWATSREAERDRRGHRRRPRQAAAASGRERPGRESSWRRRRAADRPGGCTARGQAGSSHPAARTFQALRILVNRELANLRQLLRVLPDVPAARAGGRRSSASTAARTGWSRRRFATGCGPASTRRRRRAGAAVVREKTANPRAARPNCAGPSGPESTGRTSRRVRCADRGLVPSGLTRSRSGPLRA